MRHILSVIIIGVLAGVSLLGCATANKGGKGTITQRSETITSPDGTVTVVEERKAEVDQPDSPKDAATMTVSKDDKGDFRINISTGTAHDNASSIASINLLKIPMYGGIGMLGIGAVILILSKGSKIVPALILGGTGILMIILSYTLAQYAMWYFLGFLAAVGVGIWWVVVHFDTFRKSRKALDEITTSVETAKRIGAVDPEKFKNVANAVQSEPTREIVSKIKES